MPRMGGVPIFLAVLVPIVALILLYPHNYVSPRPAQSRPQRVADGPSDRREPSLWRWGSSMTFPVSDRGGSWSSKLWPPRWPTPSASRLTTSTSLCSAGCISAGSATPFTLFWFLACYECHQPSRTVWTASAAGLALFTALLLTVVGLQNGHTAAVFLSATIAARHLRLPGTQLQPRIHLPSATPAPCFSASGWPPSASAAPARRQPPVSLLIPMIALGVPILDTSLAILRRWVRRLPISAGDRQHIHHILLRLGLSHRNAVLVVYAACVDPGQPSRLITTYADDRAVVVSPRRRPSRRCDHVRRSVRRL